jgi:hypothetical protein
VRIAGWVVMGLSRKQFEAMWRNGVSGLKVVQDEGSKAISTIVASEKLPSWY